MDLLKLTEANTKIENLTNTLEEQREQKTDAEFLALVEKYKQDCAEVYKRLNPIDWLVYKNVNVSGFVVRMTEIPIVYQDCSLDEQSIRAVIWMVGTAIKTKCYTLGFRVKGEWDIRITITKLPKRKQIYIVSIKTQRND